MDASQYQQLLQGLQNVAAQEPTQPVLDEDENDFKALTQEDLEGLGQFLLAHSGSQVLGGVNKYLGITKRAGLSPEAQKEFEEAISDGDIGKVFQKITKYGLKRVSNTLEKKGAELLRTGQDKLLPKSAQDFINPFRNIAVDEDLNPLPPIQEEPEAETPEEPEPEDEPEPEPEEPDIISEPLEDLEMNQRILQNLLPTVQEQADKEAEGQRLIEEAGQRTKALNDAQDDLDEQIRQASSTLENFIPRVERESGIVGDDLLAEEGSKAYLSPLLKGFSKPRFNTFRNRFKEARLKTSDVPDDALRRRLNSRIGENIINEMNQNIDDAGGAPDLTGDGKDAPDIYNARESLKTNQLQRAQQEARARTGEANQNLDRQNAELQDLISRAEQNQASVQDTLNNLNRIVEPEEATGADVGQELGEGFFGRLTSITGGEGGRISNAFNLTSRTFTPDTTVLNTVRNNIPLDGGRGSIVRNPINDLAQSANDRLNQVRDLAQSGKKAITQQLTESTPNLSDIKTPDLPVTPGDASNLLKNLSGDVETTVSKVSSSLSSKAEEAVTALKDLTKVSAEDDFDPANIAVTGILGLGSLIGGLFIKPKEDKDISIDPNPTNISVQIGA